jgi:hypothetical protein
MLCKTPSPFRIVRGATRKVLLVGVVNLSPKQDVAKDFDMIFTPTVGLYNVSTQSL